MNLKMFCASNALRIINDAGKETLTVNETHAVRWSAADRLYDHFNSDCIV